MEGEPFKASLCLSRRWKEREREREKEREKSSFLRLGRPECVCVLHASRRGNYDDPAWIMKRISTHYFLSQMRVCLSVCLLGVSLN